MESRYREMNSNSYFNLEQKLSKMLKPVTPNPVFLHTLKNKLARTPSIMIESSKKRIGLIAVGAGLIAGALAVWVINTIKKSKDEAQKLRKV